MKIYYGHHQYKYGTKVEDYELRLIRKVFPEAKIINPPVDIKQNRTEKEIMDDCLKNVRNCDILVFSSLSGLIGKGLYTELEEASNSNKPIYYLDCNEIKRVNNYRTRIISDKPREYALIKVIYH